MNLIEAIQCFKAEVEQAIAEGDRVETVEVEPFVRSQFLICALNDNDSPVAACGLDSDDLLRQLVEYVFLREAKQIEALHRMKDMPSVQG